MSISLYRRHCLLGSAAALGLPSWRVHAAPQSMRSHHALPVSHRGVSADVGTQESVFTRAEIAVITQLVEAILPADASPSAVSLGTSLHVQAGLALGGADAVDGARQGLAAIDGLAWQRFGQAFAALAPIQRDELVTLVTQIPALQPLWLGVRALSVLHYYAQAPAYQDLGMPGPSIDVGGFPRPNDVPCAR